nr:anthrone oxygenase family protein [Marinomonas mediterranea]
MAGVYFAFSSFIMRSLRSLSPLEGAKAMIRINEVVLKSAFMPLFFGSTLGHTLLALWMSLAPPAMPSALLITANMAYLIGMFVCTAIFNVPLNNRLLSYKDDEEQLKHYWRTYQSDWGKWNLVRTLACTLSALMLLIGWTYI